jgi:hypothetical protein
MCALLGPHTVDQNAATCFLARELARDYEIRVSGTLSLVGDPLLHEDPAYLGHMANDGAYLSSGDDAARGAYSRASADSANAAQLEIEGCHFGTFATRPIARGDEVLISYGEGYWLSRAGLLAMELAASNDARRASVRRGGGAAGGAGAPSAADADARKRFGRSPKSGKDKGATLGAGSSGSNRNPAEAAADASKKGGSRGFGAPRSLR